MHLSYRIILVVLIIVQLAAADPSPEKNIHVLMMESTCKLVGKGSLGTGFIIGKPVSNEPVKLFFTLVTAHHVLAAMQGEFATMVFRKVKDTNQWERIEVPLRIREGGKELWKKHADVDLGAMHVGLPNDAIRVIAPMSLLLDDVKLREFEISPGTELLCLGYPFGAEANPEGFPILRSGRIASYPLLPTKRTKTLLFDFSVFKGNSGGPVYLYERAPVYGGALRVGTIGGIVGVVTAERSITQRIEQLYERRETSTPLALGEVIHASFIQELVNSLPEPKNK